MLALRPARHRARPGGWPSPGLALWLWVAWTLAMALTGPAPALAAGLAPALQAGELQTVDVRPHAQSRVIAGQVTVLEDPGAQLSSAAAVAAAQGWHARDADAIRLGISRSAFWLRVRVRNAGAEPGRFVVNLASPRQDHVRWVVVDPAGRIELERETGDRMPRTSRLIDTPTVALPLVLAPGDWRDVYARVRAHDGLLEPLPVAVSGEAEFQTQASARLSLLALYGGAVLALVLYNGFLGLSTRRPEFAAYGVYGSGLLVWNLAYNGIGFAFFWPEQPILNHQLPLVAGAVAYAGAWWFIPAYLRLHERPDLQGVRRAYHWSALANLACIVPALADHYTLATLASCVAGLPMLLYTPWLAFKLARGGQREAIFLGLAFMAPVLALLVFYGQLFGWTPYTEWGTFSIQIGSFIEMGLLAFGLADSMNALKAQKLAAERRALQAQRALAQSLEVQVAERTQALERANQRLGQLAVTDELTGAFNRRRFNEVCAALIQRQPPRAAMALGMFDLDHFKRYNDRYGHLAGDAVLRNVALRVGQSLGGQGELFRLGGEEFGILFSASSADEARGLAERLRADIEAMGEPHEDNRASPQVASDGRTAAGAGAVAWPETAENAAPGAGEGAGVVTASFGVLWCGCTGPEPPTADELYAAADLALYDAKRAGRNRVVVHAMAQPAGVQSPLPAGQAAAAVQTDGSGVRANACSAGRTAERAAGTRAASQPRANQAVGA